MTVAARTQPRHEGWLVVEDRFDESTQRAAETVLTVGNGRFATRGSLEEGLSGDQPATLMHGIFAPAETVVRELANLPNWTAVEVLIDGERFSMDTGDVVASHRQLDLRCGLLRRDVTWRSPRGATVDLVFERFISRHKPDLAALRVSVTPRDGPLPGPLPIEVRASLPAQAMNDGRGHLEVADQRAVGSAADLTVNVLDTDHVLCLATELRVDGGPARCEGSDARGNPTVIARWTGTAGEPVRCEKIVAFTSSREGADPGGRARELIAGLGAGAFDALLAASRAEWERLWERSDVVIEGDPMAQLAIRFSLYHLLIAAPTDDDQVSIAAKTLSGFGYRGHVFWDTETFMLPFFIHVHPEMARNFLSYRWHRLPGARDKARAGGYQGAQIPWESADTGAEVTPKWVPNAADPSRPIRIWTGDIEIHISAVVAYAVIGYWRATGDDAFMLARGVELILETARFWAGRAEWLQERNRYELSDVIGPDEYHEHVDNNAFTNALAAWHLRTAAELTGWLMETDAAAAARLDASPAEAERFKAVADAIFVPRDPRTGLFEQFSGYFGLEDVDLKAYAGRTRSMQAILGIEGINRTQVIKQPDVLMLAYLLPELFSPEQLAVNYAYYNARTDHSYGSSLGPAIQAMLAVRMGHADDAYEHFSRAAGADLRDVRGNVSEGIHGASAGGLWQALVFGFAGVGFDGDSVTTDPRLPASWTRLAFQLVHRGKVHTIDLRQHANEAVPNGQPATAEGST
jgi:kojibiose phosphorylase